MAKEIPGESRKDEILRMGRKRFEQITTAEQHIREAALEDIKFAYNVEEGQWPAGVKEERANDKRPCHTLNKLRKFIAQISNRERDARMAGDIVPVDSNGDPLKAQIYKDIFLQIETSSQADEAYDLAGNQAISGGFGYYRILTDFVDNGFDQEITIKKIENQFSVYYDPRGQYCFIREGIPLDEFKERYKDKSQINFEGVNTGEEFALWYEPDKVFIAEYYFKEPFKKKIVLAVHPSNPEPQTIEITEKVTEAILLENGFQIVNRRTADTHKVIWVKMTGDTILEEQEWQDWEIPVIEVVGDEINIAGKKYKRSLIRDGKDAQRMYNYWLTNMTETVAMAPNAPYLISVKQIKNHVRSWQQAITKRLPFLQYNDSGKGPPRREPPPQVPSGAMAMLNIANNDIKDTIGMFEPSLGEQSNERSGKALRIRQATGDMGTLHFPDNLRRAIRKSTRIIIRLIPKIYDTQRIIRITGPKGEDEFVTINQAVIDQETGQQVIINDMSVGKYDLREDVRSFSTKRQESADFLAQAIDRYPALAPVIIDLVFKMQDWPGAAEVEKRLQEFIQKQEQAGQTPPGGKQ